MPYSYSRFIYLDTNILSYICSKIEIYRPLFDFLTINDLTIAISTGLLAELSQAKRKHSDLDRLLTMCPSALVKTKEILLQEEVQVYPNYRNETLMLYHLNSLMGSKFLEQHLSSSELAEARKIQLIFAERQEERLNQLKSNFPPPKSGKYIKEQAKEFAWIQTFQWVLSQHPTFMVKFQDNFTVFNSEVFLSEQLLAYVQFYKYLLRGRNTTLKDFGDLFYLAIIPYCKMAIIERYLCEILKQIKLHQKILENVRVENIDFIYQLIG